jgi:hypothetical protein
VSTWTRERGLVVVAATDMEDRVEALIQRGKDAVKKQVHWMCMGRRPFGSP